MYGRELREEIRKARHEQIKHLVGAIWGDNTPQPQFLRELASDLELDNLRTIDDPYLVAEVFERARRALLACADTFEGFKNI